MSSFSTLPVANDVVPIIESLLFGSHFALIACLQAICKRVGERSWSCKHGEEAIGDLQRRRSNGSGERQCDLNPDSYAMCT